MTVDRKELEQALVCSTGGIVGSGSTCIDSRHLKVLRVAAGAYLDTLPKTKIEQVARAMWEQRRKKAALDRPDLPPLEEWDDGSIPKSNGVIEEARAAIEAMRDLSPEMYDGLSATGKMWREMNSTVVWNTMIDAILAEKPA